MKKILVATDKAFAPEAIQMIRPVVENAGHQLILLENYTENSQLLEAVKDVDAMIIRSDKATREVIETAKNLKIIVRAGAGYDNIDLAACTENNVVAMNTPGQNSNAVAELAIGMMIFMARGLFNGKSGSELKGKTLGIHAFGNVGKLVAKIGIGMGMEVYAFDPFVKPEDIEKEGVNVVSTIEELYTKCQYISLHIPANAQTKKSIGYNLLSLMPKNGCLVNTARKEVINEEEMVKLMEDRKDFKYLSDIEPDNKAEFAEKFAGRYFFTPKKMGAQTEEANINAGVAAAEQIVDFFATGNMKYKVN